MRLTSLALIAGILTTGLAQAQVVYFDYTARVDRTTYRTPATDYQEVEAASISANGSTIAPGYTVRGWVAIDLATGLYDYRPENGPAYNYRGSPSNIAHFSVEQTGYGFTTDASRWPYSHGYFLGEWDSGHSFGFDGSNTQHRDNWESQDQYIYLTMGDNNADLLANWPSMTLADAESSWLVYGFDAFDPALGVVNAYATLTSFSPRATSPVPEPTTWLMTSLGLGLVGAGAYRRRRSAA